MCSRGVQVDFDWSKYLDLAQELIEESSGADAEARLRSSVSRAYYAAFCKARNHLRDTSGYLMPLLGETHKLVINSFRNSTEPELRLVGNNLERLRIDRNKVDYDDSVSGLESMAQLAVLLAQQIISTLENLKND